MTQALKTALLKLRMVNTIAHTGTMVNMVTVDQLMKQRSGQLHWVQSRY